MGNDLIESVKILTVDDHALVREGLQVILRRSLPQAEFAEAASGSEMFAMLEQQPHFDLVLLDVQLPDGSGISFLERLRARHPQMPVMILSAEHTPTMVADAINRGASGFVSKASLGQVLVSAIQLVLAGGIYLPPEMLRAPTAAPGASAYAPPGASAGSGQGAAAVSSVTVLPSHSGPGLAPGGSPYAANLGLHAAANASPANPAAQGHNPAAHNPENFGLTGRQLDVLWLLLEGCSNKQICRELGLAEPTVKIHVRAILRALDASSRTEVVVLAARLGWTRPATGSLQA